MIEYDSISTPSITSAYNLLGSPFYINAKKNAKNKGLSECLSDASFGQISPHPLVNLFESLYFQFIVLHCVSAVRSSDLGGGGGGGGLGGGGGGARWWTQARVGVLQGRLCSPPRLSRYRK